MQDLKPYTLIGTYNGEVCLGAEYDANRKYDMLKGDNLRDDKTKILWDQDGGPGCPQAWHLMCPIFESCSSFQVKLSLADEPSVQR